MSTPAWRSVLDFWFLPVGEPGHLQSRPAWFQRSDAFDAQIREQFGGLVEQAVEGGLQDWDAHPDGALARILVLDQFTRNMWRGTPRAFSGDALALASAERLVAEGLNLSLHPVQRVFVYLPFEHAEDKAHQARSVDLFLALVEAAGPDYASFLDFAIRHQEVVDRFGRFPHRNAILGRPSTPAERAFLERPGSSF